MFSQLNVPLCNQTKSYGVLLTHLCLSIHYEIFGSMIRSVIDNKESNGITDPMEKIAMKSNTDYSDSGIETEILINQLKFIHLLIGSNFGINH